MSKMNPLGDPAWIKQFFFCLKSNETYKRSCFDQVILFFCLKSAQVTMIPYLAVIHHIAHLLQKTWGSSNYASLPRIIGSTLTQPAVSVHFSWFE